MHTLRFLLLVGLFVCAQAYSHDHNCIHDKITAAAPETIVVSQEHVHTEGSKRNVQELLTQPLRILANIGKLIDPLSYVPDNMEDDSGTCYKAGDPCFYTDNEQVCVVLQA